MRRQLEVKVYVPTSAFRKVVEVSNNWPSYSVLIGNQKIQGKTVVKR